MRLSFHQRILLILICLGAVPTAVAIVGWGLTIRAASPVAGPREALEEVGATGRALLRTLDTTDLSPEERAALAAHAVTLNSAIGQFQRAETYGRYYYAGLAIAVFLLGAAALYASIRLGGHLSRQLSRPIEELIGWTGHIRRWSRFRPTSRAAARPSSPRCGRRCARWRSPSSTVARRRSRPSACARSGRPPAASRTR
ncbi:MAG TPA: hypothetical protein VHG35_09230 [Gemmatimonadales bacterium]|nr:hypothetical protein [Gemmatimonadales bacterium]